MPQTLLAILAIAITSMVALNQHTGRLHAQKEIIRKEISTQMMAVATDRLEHIGHMAFDENTIGNNILTSPDQLTHPDNFDEDGQNNDIDDFNERSDHAFRIAAGREVWFDLKTTVTYAHENNPDVAVSHRTKFKKATVEVWPKDTLGINTEGGFQIPDRIKLSQTYACGSWCKW